MVYDSARLTARPGADSVQATQRRTLMTGPEHYRKAEELLGQAEELLGTDEPSAATWAVEQAQVHATLALAAATALRDIDSEEPAWVGIAGTARG
jgi:hypothetical protein